MKGEIGVGNVYRHKLLIINKIWTQKSHATDYFVHH